MKALAIGTKMQSYMGIKRTMEKLKKDFSEAAGISKPRKIVRSRVARCLVKKVVTCADTIAKPKLVAPIGISLRNCLCFFNMINTANFSLQGFVEEPAALKIQIVLLLEFI